MLVPNNPDIDVPRLLECVRLELSRARNESAVMAAPRRLDGRRAEPAVDALAALPGLLDTLRARNATRNGLPDWALKRFPFLRLPLFARIVVRIHSVLFYDQRHANEAIGEALKVLAGAVTALQVARDNQLDSLRGEVLVTVETHLAKMAMHLDETKGGMLPITSGASYNDLLQTCRRQEALLEQLIEVTREDISLLRRNLVEPNGYAAEAD